MSTTAPAGSLRPYAARHAWPAGLLVALLLVGLGVVLAVRYPSQTLPTTAASRFVPADATRTYVGFRQGNSSGTASVENARLDGTAMATAMSGAAYAAMDVPDADAGSMLWWREAVLPDEVGVAARYRVRSVDAVGIWLHVQDWEERGIALQRFLELPADVAPGRTWSSSGAASADPVDQQRRYRNTSSAAAPSDAARTAAGCLQVTSRTVLTGGERTESWDETSLWCPGSGQVTSSGTFRGTAYAVTPRSGPSDAEPKAPTTWDSRGYASWTAAKPDLYDGDPTFGGDVAHLEPRTPPVVTTSGIVAYSSDGGSGLTGLLPLGADSLWWHWWARPGGAVTSTAAIGPYVAVTTTDRRLLLYRSGAGVVWTATLDDVAVVPAVQVGDDALAVGTVAGTVTVFDLATGATRWHDRLGSGVHDALAAAGAVLVAADAGPDVTAWDVGTGTQLWSNSTGSALGTQVSVIGDRVVVAANGTVTAYGRDDGNQLWTRNAGVALNGAESVAGQVWVDTDDGVSGWSPVDGHTLWTSPGTRPAPGAAATCSGTSGGLAGLALRGGRLVGLDARGTTLASWPVAGSADEVVAVSCRQGRVWVAAKSPELTVVQVGPPA